MNIGFYLAHPSQYYVFRNIIKTLQSRHRIFVFIKSKDILELLLTTDNIGYINIFPEEKKPGYAGLIKSVIIRNKRLIKQFKEKRIDILISAASDSSQASFLYNIPSIILNDDDYTVIKNSYYFGWPFSTIIFAPSSCNMGYFRKSKTIFYEGFQKSNYLHPKYFKPNEHIIEKYGLTKDKFFIIRTVKLNAHHDKKIRGLNCEIVERLIKMLSPYGRILLSSEKQIPSEFSSYILNINPLDIHHLIFYSRLLIGDSQSMAHEAALLGTPSIRFNDFIGRIGVLNELEEKYNLTYAISPDNPDLLFNKVQDLLSASRNDYRIRAEKLMKEKIDLTQMLLWFIENYPQSYKIMKIDPGFQFTFR